MKLAIIGLPQSGKSTLFNALIRSDEELAVSGTRVEVRQATVNVPDEKLLALATLYQAKKTVQAQMNYADIAGFDGGEEGQGLSGQLLNALSGMDALLIVLRAFQDDSVPHSLGSVDPARDLQTLTEDLLINDLIAVERKLERLAEERQKGGRDIQAVEGEIKLFQSILDRLNENLPLRHQQIGERDIDILAGLGLLTLKPALFVLNLGEGQDEIPMDSAAENVKLEGLSIQGKLEMELAQLPDVERPAFQREYGIEESGAQRVIRTSYEMMNIITFYTVTEKEAHAWTLPNGATALEAAGTVHSDFARGFIRAEVIAADELLQYGTPMKARDAGRLRLEGKDYIVQDGDVIQVRFNV